jgi:hypothetical protein
MLRLSLPFHADLVSIPGHGDVDVSLRQTNALRRCRIHLTNLLACTFFWQLDRFRLVHGIGYWDTVGIMH